MSRMSRAVGVRGGLRLTAAGAEEIGEFVAMVVFAYPMQRR